MNILVTGATAGIGRATAEYLDSVGHRIVMVARRNDVLCEIASSMENNPLCIAYDLLDLENIERIFIQCNQANVKLDGLVHCAGINRDMPIKVNDVAVMMDVTKLNYMAFVELGKYFSSPRYSNTGSSIVAMSSTAVFSCLKSMCSYTATKAAVDTTVRIMAKEFAKRKIRVNSIQPTYVDTEMIRNIPDWEAKAAAMPLGLIEPIQIAYLIEFLLSDKAKYISGSQIKVSSGSI